MSATGRLVLATCVTWGLGGGCQGRIGPVDQQPARRKPAEQPGTGTPVAPTILPVRARLIDRFEYNNSVVDLLGDRSDPADMFPAEAAQSGFSRNADQSVGGVLAGHLQVAAHDLATAAVSHLDRLVSCKGGNSRQSPCSDAFIEAFARKAYRRPLTDQDRADLRAVFASGSDFSSGIALVIETVLQSGSFLYASEIGGDDATDTGERSLTPHETASALSFLILGAPPDDALSTAADAGQLTPDARRAQTARLLMDPRAGAQVRRFAFEWFQVANLANERKDADTYPRYPGLIPSMLEETGAFVEDAILAGPGTLSALLEANTTFVDQGMADLYGLDVTVPMGAQTRVSLAGTGRAGLLTQASFLSTHGGWILSSPIRRGAFVRTRLLCQRLPDPPPGLVIAMPSQAPANSTTRQLFDAHVSAPQCSGCHAMIDPIGNAFEHFDSDGAFREIDGGQHVDSSGALTGTAASNQSFTDAVGLAHLLAGSAEAQTCYQRMFFRFASAQSEPGAEQAFLDLLQETGASTDYVGMLTAYVGSDLFTRRRVP